MLDIHRERLKHLLANAILELWKKETGSLASVLIEGTICITTGSGKTTVVQVADHFTGVFPESEDERNFNNRRYSTEGGPHNYMMAPPINKFPIIPRAWEGKGPLSVAAYLDELSPASLVSPRNSDLPPIPRQEWPHRPESSLALGPEPAFVKPAASSPTSDSCKDMSVASESESDNDDNNDDVADQDDERHTQSETRVDREGGDIQERSRVVPVIHKVAAYYPRMDSELESSPGSDTTTSRSSGGHEAYATGLSSAQDLGDSGVQDLSVEHTSSPKSLASSPSMVTSTPKDKEDHQRSARDRRILAAQEIKKEIQDCDKETMQSDKEEEDYEKDVGGKRRRSSGSEDAVDLSRKGGEDLALSAPQNYTAQVRDVIRQRILAGNSRGSSVPSSPVPGSLEGFQFADPKLYGHSLGLLGSLELWPPDKRDLKFPLSSGPPTWPMAGRHRQSPLPQGDNKMFLSPQLGPTPLTIGLPTSTMMPSALSHPLLTAFPGFAHHQPLHHLTPSLPGSPALLSEGFGILKKSSLSSPQGFAHHNGAQDGEAVTSGQMPLHLMSRANSPDLADINGNTDKEFTASGEQKVYRCEYCNKTFLFKSKYHEHLPVHTNVRPFQCHMCSRTYKYKYDLRVHLRTHMGIPTKSTVCPFCSGKFTTNKLLRLHITEAHRDRQQVSEHDCTQPFDNLPPAI